MEKEKVSKVSKVLNGCGAADLSAPGACRRFGQLRRRWLRRRGGAGGGGMGRGGGGSLVRLKCR